MIKKPPHRRRLLAVFVGEHNRSDLGHRLKLVNEGHLRKAYIKPALEAGLIEMTIPDKPDSRLQKYRLSAMGKKLVERNSLQKI